MKIILTLAACALAAVALSGCGTLSAGQSNLAPVITALAAAGCTGDLQFNIQAGSAAGISPGSFSVGNTFHGACDPRNAPATGVPPAPATK